MHVLNQFGHAKLVVGVYETRSGSMALTRPFEENRLLSSIQKSNRVGFETGNHSRKEIRMEIG